MNYTCLADAGPNPDFGYTNFDHMGWSLVMSFQLLTMDFWENIYNKVSDRVLENSNTITSIDFALHTSLLPVDSAETRNK